MHDKEIEKLLAVAEEVEEVERAVAEAEEFGYITLECGCTVEPDGKCPCGNISPLVKVGLV